MNKFKEWKKEVLEHKTLIILSLIFLTFSLILDYLSGKYTTRIGSVTSPDLILDYIAPLDLSYIFSYGYVFVFACLILYPLLFKVNKFHVAISQISLLTVVRSMFICFTHLKTPAEAIAYKLPAMVSHLGFQNDLFFSGHTAFPFLGFLLFKDSRIRYFFLASSIILGATVLIMHRHYSIDVFSAYFITYGTYKIGEWFFKKINHY